MDISRKNLFETDMNRTAIKEAVAVAPKRDNSWNVISETDFKNAVSMVFEKVSGALRKTLGPYGSTTIIEKYGETHITKDGWQVLKSIHFNDALYNNILMLLLRISAQVVIKVGDGSTSSIVSANEILNSLENISNSVSLMRPRAFMDNFGKCIDKIVEAIKAEAKSVNRDTFEEIYRLAYISTNGDEEISNMIQDIYKKTNNPAIEYVKSKTDKTTYEIVNGYRGNITYLDNIFITNDDGTCAINEPYILMFDHKIDVDSSLPVIGKAVEKALNADKRLVVIAPNYDKYLLEYIKKNIMIEFKSRGTSTVVYARASMVNNISQEMYNDFSILCGAQVISEQFESEIVENNTIDDYIGCVENMVIGDKTTFIQGFTHRNENMYQKIVDDAASKYNKMLIDNQNKAIVDIKLNEHKQRLTKLRCNMGIISVGGVTSLEKTARTDLVEDAIKACESAYTSGFNIGGNLIIPWVIRNRILNSDEKMDSDIYEMYIMIADAFANVFKKVLRNRYVDNAEADIDQIINTCITSDTPVCYDLISEKYSEDIINSCETDIEILKATASIISLLISSNQYVSIEITK